jgi:hypothetical protein
MKPEKPNASGNRNMGKNHPAGKNRLKHVLGEIPLTAEVYWQLRQQGKPVNKSFSLHRTKKLLPEWIAQAETARKEVLVRQPAATRQQKVLLFTTLRYWIEHATLLSLAMSGLGYDVTLAYLPYNNWRARTDRFDLRRHNLYAEKVLRPAAQLIHPVSWYQLKPATRTLPADLQAAVQRISERDVQYTLQVEEVDRTSDLYNLRLERNTQAGQAALSWMKAHRPDIVITPNGSILEMGAIYQVAQYLEIPVVTYEFGEQRGRIWLARNDEVMLQHSDEMWSAVKDNHLSQAQTDQISALYASRQNASLWENFSRRWQGLPSQGGDQVRQNLGLDARPVALLAANVIGDSLTLGRQVFSRDMTEWLQRTIRNFAQRPDVQLVVRVHPGERYTRGPSVADIVSQIFAQQIAPELHGAVHRNIRLVAADDPINTYDLVEIADLGLVYTTTVGMEMAMSGVPVIVAGHTHYRGKGFTHDPVDWEDYFETVNRLLADPKRARLGREQVDTAWQYAYHFYFDFPLPFPWHLLHFWNELDEWPITCVLSDEGQRLFGDTFRCLVGEPRQWSQPSEFYSPDNLVFPSQDQMTLATEIVNPLTPEQSEQLL